MGVRVIRSLLALSLLLMSGTASSRISARPPSTPAQPGNALYLPLLAQRTPTNGVPRAHLVAFVGHNGLMDFVAPALRRPSPNAQPRAAIVLACASHHYFTRLLRRADAHPLLLTTGLMAPEAYTLDAALKAWFTTGSPQHVRRKAAAAYHRYQRCGTRAALRLFTTVAP